MHTELDESLYYMSNPKCYNSRVVCAKVIHFIFPIQRNGRKKKRQFFDFFTRIEYWAGCSVRPLSYLYKKKNGFSNPLHPFLVKNPLIYPQPLMNKRSLFTFHCVCVSLNPPPPSPEKYKVLWHVQIFSWKKKKPSFGRR